MEGVSLDRPNHEGTPASLLLREEREIISLRILRREAVKVEGHWTRSTQQRGNPTS